jgi:hypothetical protein
MRCTPLRRSFPGILYQHFYLHPFLDMYYMFLHGVSRHSGYGFSQIIYPLLFQLQPTIRGWGGVRDSPHAQKGFYCTVSLLILFLILFVCRR